MSLGGRLNAHNNRIKDFRRRKDGKIKGSNIIRSKKDDQIKFEKIDSDKVAEIKKEIRRKGKLNRRKEIVLLIVSTIIGLIVTWYFAKSITD